MNIFGLCLELTAQSGLESFFMSRVGVFVCAFVMSHAYLRRVRGERL